MVKKVGSLIILTLNIILAVISLILIVDGFTNFIPSLMRLPPLIILFYLPVFTFIFGIVSFVNGLRLRKTEAQKLSKVSIIIGLITFIGAGLVLIFVIIFGSALGGPK